MTDLTNFIIELRGEKVILDFNLSKLYGIPTKVFKQTVRRNLNRFPEDFMFTLTEFEVIHMRSQFVTSEKKSMDRSPPMAFTEFGVAMLSSVLRNQRAIEINIMIIRIFILMRKTLMINNNLELKLQSIENELSDHSTQLKILFDQLNKRSDDSENRKIGFNTDI